MKCLCAVESPTKLPVGGGRKSEGLSMGGDETQPPPSTDAVGRITYESLPAYEPETCGTLQTF
jgi:hypothetical protein